MGLINLKQIIQYFGIEMLTEIVSKLESNCHIIAWTSYQNKRIHIEPCGDISNFREKEDLTKYEKFHIISPTFI